LKLTSAVTTQDMRDIASAAIIAYCETVLQNVNLHTGKKK